MAVPFNIPEDQNEVEVIINQLQALLTKLQAAIRRSRDSRSTNPQLSHEQPSTSRVRQNGSSRSPRARDEAASSNSSSIPPNIPELLNNLAWLAAVSQETAVSTSQLTTVSIVRSPRRRTSSESSSCEETKIATTASVSHGTNQGWNQVGVTPQKITDQHAALLTEVGCEQTSPLPKLFSANGFLSKFVPGPVSAPIWTAMICFVGWHLFKAR